MTKRNIERFFLLLLATSSIFSSCKTRQISALNDDPPSSDDAVSCLEICWVGTNRDSGYIALGRSIELSPVTQPILGQKNMKLSAGKFEVYNQHLDKWFSTGIDENDVNKIDRRSFVKKVVSISNDTDPIKVTISLTESTEGAAIYLDNKAYGTVDENGRYSNSPGSWPRDAIIILSLLKKKCQEIRKELTVQGGQNDDFVYKNSIILNCK